MATPRARGGSSLTTLPPIKRSPLVCCSSPQMIRRNVVLPQPEGPSSTMNSPSGTVSEMPLTAGTSPNFLTISLVNTADIEPPNFSITGRRPRRSPRRGAPCRPICKLRHRRPRQRRGPPRWRSGPVVPLLEDGFALLRGQLDRILGGHLAGRGIRHHVADNEVVVDLVDRRPGRPRIAGS